ncbi:MAG: phosphoribosylanthranilate isomerase [Schwartzia sp.]|nr:phosphoribosylanthranilate isomerase [Schwartzia sp. (in: firmicutes)]
MKVKICGLRTLEAAQTAERAGADFLGFIMWPESRRFVPASQAADIVRSLSGGAISVGVVVDQPVGAVAALARRCRFDAIQLHGHEPPEYAEQLRASADVRIIKAFRWRDDFSVETANEYPADYILLDTFKKGMAGGTGEVFRWHEAAEETRNLNKPLLLAGGISAENAEEAARTLSPFALDVSGSLEENGEKSPEKIRAFMRTIDEIRNEAVQ